MTEFPSLAEVVRKHRLIAYLDPRDKAAKSYRCECEWTSPEWACTRSDHPEHVEAEWIKACTITTVEQLDSLPNGSIVQTAHGNALLRWWGEWLCSGVYGHWAPDDTVSVPYLLLRHPDWSTQ